MYDAALRSNDTKLHKPVFGSSVAVFNWMNVQQCLDLHTCVIVLAIVLPYFMSRSWSLTALRMGEEKAASLGVNVSFLRLTVLAGVSLLAAVAVSFVGAVAFVGLVGPNIARIIVGEDQRGFLPLSALEGALIMAGT